MKKKLNFFQLRIQSTVSFHSGRNLSKEQKLYLIVKIRGSFLHSKKLSLSNEKKIEFFSVAHPKYGEFSFWKESFKRTKTLSNCENSWKFSTLKKIVSF